MPMLSFDADAVADEDAGECHEFFLSLCPLSYPIKQNESGMD